MNPMARVRPSISHGPLVAVLTFLLMILCAITGSRLAGQFSEVSTRCGRNPKGLLDAHRVRVREREGEET